MRIWSIHPKYLDAKGLVALWRETLLAKNVLEGNTKAYKNHPQLYRFKIAPDPLEALNYYLQHVWLEANSRSYSFDKTKFSLVKSIEYINVTKKQLNFEWIYNKQFLLTQPLELFPKDKNLNSLQRTLL